MYIFYSVKNLHPLVGLKLILEGMVSGTCSSNKHEDFMELLNPF